MKYCIIICSENAQRAMLQNTNVIEKLHRDICESIAKML